jgi:hypothetical protein
MTYRLNIVGFYTPQQSYPILQPVFLPHLFQFHHLWSVSTYDESDFGEEVAYGRG